MFVQLLDYDYIYYTVYCTHLLTGQGTAHLVVAPPVWAGPLSSIHPYSTLQLTILSRRKNYMNLLSNTNTMTRHDDLILIMHQSGFLATVQVRINLSPPPLKSAVRFIMFISKHSPGNSAAMLYCNL